MIGATFVCLLALPLAVWGPIERRRDFDGAFWAALILMLLLTWGWDTLARGNLDIRPRRKH